MKNLLKIVSAVVAMSATTAAAQTAASETTPAARPAAKPVAGLLATDEGWNSEWALLFSLNNFFQDGSFLGSGGAGTVSANYFLTEDTAIRAGINLTRFSNPLQITKITTTVGNTPVVTYDVNTPGITDIYGINLSGDYLMRLSTSSVAPYVGGGLEVGYSLVRNNYLDEVSVTDQRTEVDATGHSIDVSVRGILGAEWRLHPNFAIYAEYALSLSLINSTISSSRVTTESGVGTPTPATSQVLQEQTVNRFLQLETDLAQGASLGLQVFF